MVTQTWLYDIIVYIYALALLFYFSDAFGTNRRAKRMGTGLLTFVWFLQGVFFVLRTMDLEQLPIYSLFDVMFLFAWVLVTMSLVLSRFAQVELLVFLINVFGFTMLALTVFSDPHLEPSLAGWDIQDELLLIHISLAIASYAAFATSAVLSGMYLFLYFQLKKKKWSQLIRRFPSLERLERYTHTSLLLGTPLLLLSLCLGIAWIILSGRLELLIDLKVLNSIVILLMYSVLLMLRSTGRLAGFQQARGGLLAFGVIIVNLLLANSLSGFHQWIWK